MKTLRRYLGRYLREAKHARPGRPWAYLAAHVAGDYRLGRDVGLDLVFEAS